MFPRSILSEFRSWAAEQPRKPLVLRGARQVGKTSVVRIFADEFDAFVPVDLDEPADARLFGRGLTVSDLYQAILLEKGITPGSRTLLFIDEIQNSADAMAYLGRFRDQLPDVHLIAAGSLLEAVLARGDISFPVGRVEQHVMLPLSFREFLVAIGDEPAVAALDTVPVPRHAVEHLFERFHRYALVGGMPEIVAAYSESGQVPGLDRLYQSLLRGFIDDVSKYARNATLELVLRHAIEAAPFEAGKRIRFAGFGNSNYRSREMGEALRTLERAMLIRLLHPTTVVEPPIIPDLRKSPRLQFLDTGLVNYLVGLQSEYFSYNDLNAIHRGVVAQHVVGQELLCQAADLVRKPSFWVREKRQSSAEVDFVISHRDRVVPVEVKAGKSGTLRSLHQFVDRASHGVAVRLYRGPLSVQSTKTPKGRSYTMLGLPYFLAGQLRSYLDWLEDEPGQGDHST